MQTLKKNRKGKPKKIIGKLFATWCGHCQQMEPEWKKMKDNVIKYSKNDEIEFVEIESKNMKQGLANLNKTFRTNIKLQGGYPTLFKIETGKNRAEYYNGGRTAAEMTKWSMITRGGKTSGKTSSKTSNKTSNKTQRRTRRQIK
jgi:thiol-disulfide isomerase/thioredoxin